MDAQLADRLRQLGNGFDLPEVQALYAPLMSAQPRDGFVAALPNYRLAPESRWPCGPEALATVHQA